MIGEQYFVNDTDEGGIINAWSLANKLLYNPTNPIRDFEHPEVLASVSFDAAPGVILRHVKAYFTAINREPIRDLYYLPFLLTHGGITKEMEEAIAASRTMLDIEIDREAGINVPYLNHTWERAIKLLRELAVIFWQQSGEAIPVPAIGPAPEGSIDLFWELPKLTLLVNIPSDLSKEVTFYGRRLQTSKISGVLGREDVQPRHLTGWLSGHDLRHR